MVWLGSRTSSRPDQVCDAEPRSFLHRCQRALFCLLRATFSRILDAVMLPRVQTKQPDAAAFLPMSRAEMEARGWDALDVLIITGDAYVDHPSFGTAMIGRFLEAEGLRVGVVAQPEWTKIESITVMGVPK